MFNEMISEQSPSCDVIESSMHEDSDQHASMRPSKEPVDQRIHVPYVVSMDSLDCSLKKEFPSLALNAPLNDKELPSLPLTAPLLPSLPSNALLNAIITRNTHGLANNDTALRDKLTDSGSYDREQDVPLKSKGMTSDNIIDLNGESRFDDYEQPQQLYPFNAEFNEETTELNDEIAELILMKSQDKIIEDPAEMDLYGELNEDMQLELHQPTSHSLTPLPLSNTYPEKMNPNPQGQVVGGNPPHTLDPEPVPEGPRTDSVQAISIQPPAKVECSVLTEQCSTVLSTGSVSSGAGGALYIGSGTSESDNSGSLLIGSSTSSSGQGECERHMLPLSSTIIPQIQPLLPSITELNYVIADLFTLKVKDDMDEQTKIDLSEEVNNVCSYVYICI
jgi:hypothetical protein